MTDNAHNRLRTILGQVRNERRGGSPHVDWVARNKEVLMMQVRNTTDASSAVSMTENIRHAFSLFFPTQQLLVAARVMAVFVLAAGITLSGGIATAQLYGDAIPGDFAYGVKTAVERTQIALAPNDAYRMRLLTEFADRRVDEIARLAEGDAARHDAIPKVLGSLEQTVLAMQDTLESMRASDPVSVVEAAKLMERKMVAYHGALTKARDSVAPAVRVQIAAAGVRVDDGMVSALALIVEAHLAGDTGASGAVLASKFESRIRQAEEVLATATAQAPAATEKKQQTQRAIADAKDLIQREEYQAALMKIEEIAKLTAPDAPEPEEKDEEEGATPAAPQPGAVMEAPSGTSKEESGEAGPP